MERMNQNESNKSITKQCKYKQYRNEMKGREVNHKHSGTIINQNIFILCLGMPLPGIKLINN